MIFSLSILASCSDKKLDKEAQGVVDGIMAYKGFANTGWTKENVICWVQETRKLLNDEEWKFMKISYDPNVKGDVDMDAVLDIAPKMGAAAEECKVKIFKKRF